MDALDFMDPKRRRQHDIMLVIGYLLVGIAILLLTTILLFSAYGFGLKNGQVIQNGLLFVSSKPNPAQIYINGTRYSNNTNTRVILPEGTYNFDLRLAGYRDWQRTITVQGGQVESFTYPFLFPSTLVTSTWSEYSAPPAVVTQSPDRHWLLVARPESLVDFDLYDLNNPTRPPVIVSVPSVLFPAGVPASVQVIEWSDDNTHLLLRYSAANSQSYILLDRSTPAQSQNLSKLFGLSQTGITMRLSNKRYDQYVIYDATKQTLLRLALSAPQAQLYVNDRVLAFTTYGDTTVLYVTPDPTNAAKVDIDLYDGSTVYVIRHDMAGSKYLLDLANYSGNLYVAIGVTAENEAYVYENPAQQITNPQLSVAVPVDAFHLPAPAYLAFSASAEYVLFENGKNFAVYDAENQQGYTYTVSDTLDQPQVHAVWMDAAHILYISGGQIVVLDFDGKNHQDLTSADPSFVPAFDANYKFMYTLVPAAANKSHRLLSSTALTTAH